jgi:hypothetical protein
MRRDTSAASGRGVTARRGARRDAAHDGTAAGCAWPWSFDAVQHCATTVATQYNVGCRAPARTCTNLAARSPRPWPSVLHRASKLEPGSLESATSGTVPHYLHPVCQRAMLT